VTLPSASPSTVAMFSASRMFARPLKTLSLLLLFMVPSRVGAGIEPSARPTDPGKPGWRVWERHYEDQVKPRQPRKAIRPARASCCRNKPCRSGSAHYAVGVRRLDQVILVKAAEPQCADIQRGCLPVHHQFGHQLADDWRHLEAVAAKADCTIRPFQPRAAIEDRVPVGRDRIQSSIAASAITAVHGGIAPAQAVPNLRQPVA